MCRLSVCNLSVLKTHYLSEPPSCSIVEFLRGVGIKIETGGLYKRVLTPFRNMNYHDAKMHNVVVPPKTLLHKKE